MLVSENFPTLSNLRASSTLLLLLSSIYPLSLVSQFILLGSCP